MSLVKAVSGLCLSGALLWSTAPAASAANLPDCTIKASGNIITQSMAAEINELKSWSIEAADEESVSWLFLPVLLYRENSLQTNNPSNGQGAFQLYSYVTNWRTQYAKDHGIGLSKLDDSLTPFPSTEGEPVSKPNFIKQARIALQYLKTAANQVKTAGLSEPDPLTVAWAFFTYNGRHPGYYAQAARLHQRYPESYLYPFEGSPYVYSHWDAAHTGNLFIVQSDGGRLSDHVDEKVGAFTLYYELVRQCDPASLPASTHAQTDPAKRPSPFGDQSAPTLPPQGDLPQPWYALAGFVGAALLSVLMAPAFRRSYSWAGVWGVTLFGLALLIHNDDVTLQQASYVPHQTGLALAMILASGILAAITVVCAVSMALSYRPQEHPELRINRLHRLFEWPQFRQRTASFKHRFLEAGSWQSKASEAAKGLGLAVIAVAFGTFLAAITVICFLCLGLFCALLFLRDTIRWWKMPFLVAIGLAVLYRVSAPPDPAYAHYAIKIMLILIPLTLLVCSFAYLNQKQKVSV